MFACCVDRDILTETSSALPTEVESKEINKVDQNGGNIFIFGSSQQEMFTSTHSRTLFV